MTCEERNYAAQIMLENALVSSDPLEWRIETALRYLKGEQE
jgi:hypothetical protein